MANGQETMSIKTKLSKLHCPFTWEILDNVIKHSIYHESSNDENDQIIDNETSYPLERLLISLFKCYKAVSSADINEATNKIGKAEEMLIQIQQGKEFCQMIRTIEHVFYATKCFFLYDVNDIAGLEEILQNIIDPENFNDIELGALYGCQSVVWSCLNEFGMNKAVDTAKKAVERNQDCALWHFVLAKNLRRQRRSINFASIVSNMEKEHFEIAYAMSKNDMFGIYYLQMRIESFLKFSREKDYVMKKNANEKEVINIAKQILRMKPANHNVLLRLALIFLRANSDERLSAKECLDAVYKVAPNNATCLHYTAMLYQQSGDYKEALKYFKKAAECNNLVAELSYIQYGWEVGEMEPLPHLLRMLKKYEQSIKERQIAILLAIAVTYYSLHRDVLNAAEYFLKALTIDSLSNKFKVKFKLCWSAMDVTSVRVRIYDEEKCIHDRKVDRSNGDDLKTLIQNLRDVQSEVNDFLTTLIQRRVSGKMTNRSISSDIESDSIEKEKEEEEQEEEEEEKSETQANPKKCKLSA